jgi:GcrA cell cycle regulator
MSWTEQRVELLRQLWNAQFSASRIAAELGITRNAVIGKIHRLGLWGRGQPSVSLKRQRKRERHSIRVHVCRPASIGNTALDANSDDLPHVNKPQALVVPIAKKLTIGALTEHTCKWPIGDPRECDFHYCGHDSLQGLPYCEHHARVAYRSGNSVPLPSLASG